MIFKSIVQMRFIYFILAFAWSAATQELSNAPNIPSPIVIDVTLSDDQPHTWTSVNFPNSYPTYNQDLIIKTDYGFSILITIEEMDIDSQNGDFLVIKSGTTLDAPGKGKIFVYKLKSKKTYLVHSNAVYLSLQVHGNNEIGKKGFSLTYKRLGEQITTTTSNPTTVVTWPTPSESDSIYYSAYVSGKSQEDFKDNQTLLNLKTAVVEMATEYCNTSKIILSENITEKNVLIYYLSQCTYTWPNSDTCMKVRFALPVILHENSTWTGYQLTTPHLEQMWTHLASTYLRKYEMDVYSVPDNSSSLTKWVVISVIVLILFLILLYFVKIVGRYFSPLNTGKARLGDISGILSRSTRTSDTSLEPHPFQSTPPFFDNDYPFDKFDIDFDIDDDIFDMSRDRRFSIDNTETES